MDMELLIQLKHTQKKKTQQSRGDYLGGIQRHCLYTGMELGNLQLREVQDRKGFLKYIRRKMKAK